MKKPTLRYGSVKRCASPEIQQAGIVDRLR